MARITAAVPRIRLPVVSAAAVAVSAPNTVTPEMAFIPDIRGVCNRGGTCLMIR
jgi:hypothetical protein